MADPFLQQMVDAGMVDDRLRLLMQSMQRGQGLRNAPSAQGMNVGQTYRASSPLEHLATAMSRVKGDRMISDAEGQMGGLLDSKRDARTAFAANPNPLAGALSGDPALAAGGQVVTDQRAAERAATVADRKWHDEREATRAEAGFRSRQQDETERAARAREQAERAKLEADAWAMVPDPVYGGFMRYNKKTGQYDRAGDPGAGAPPPAGAPGAGGPSVDLAAPPGFKMTEPQAKAFSAVSRIREARKMMEEAGYPSGLGGRKDAWATGASGGALGAVTPQEAASEPGQRYFTAGRNLIAALLRKESGAAITKDEWEELGPLYIPMPWDDDATRANKLRMLDVMEESAVMESGPAAASHLTREKANAATAAAPGTGPARVQTKAERDALPTGTQYVGPDGVTYTKR